MRSLHQVRAVALTDYAEVARSAGLEPLAMLQQAGIDAKQLNDPETRLPASAVINLLETSARQSGCLNFGMMMAERRTFESLGPIVPILRQQRTLREVIDATVDGRRSFNDLVGIKVNENSEHAFIEVLMLPSFAGAQAVTLLVAMAYRLLNGASGGSWKPRAVHLHTSAPDDAGIFQRFFGVPVRFGSNVDGFECDRISLDRSFDPRNQSEDFVELVSSLEQRIRELRQSGVGAADEILVQLEAALSEIRSSAGLPPPSKDGP